MDHNIAKTLRGFKEHAELAKKKLDNAKLTADQLNATVDTAVQFGEHLDQQKSAFQPNDQEDSEQKSEDDPESASENEDDFRYQEPSDDGECDFDDSDKKEDVDNAEGDKGGMDLNEDAGEVAAPMSLMDRAEAGIARVKVMVEKETLFRQQLQMEREWEQRQRQEPSPIESSDPSLLSTIRLGGTFEAISDKYKEEEEPISKACHVDIISKWATGTHPQQPPTYARFQAILKSFGLKGQRQLYDYVSSQQMTGLASLARRTFTVLPSETPRVNYKRVVTITQLREYEAECDNLQRVRAYMAPRLDAVHKRVDAALQSGLDRVEFFYDGTAAGTGPSRISGDANVVRRQDRPSGSLILNFMRGRALQGDKAGLEGADLKDFIKAPIECLVIGRRSKDAFELSMEEKVNISLTPPQFSLNVQSGGFVTEYILPCAELCSGLDSIENDVILIATARPKNSKSQLPYWIGTKRCDHFHMRLVCAQRACGAVTFENFEAFPFDLWGVASIDVIRKQQDYFQARFGDVSDGNAKGFLKALPVTEEKARSVLTYMETKSGLLVCGVPSMVAVHAILSKNGYLLPSRKWIDANIGRPFTIINKKGQPVVLSYAPDMAAGEKANEQGKYVGSVLRAYVISNFTLEVDSVKRERAL